MELFYENSFNGFRPFTTFALKLRLRCLIGSNTAILYIHLFIIFYEQNLSVNFHGGAGISQYLRTFSFILCLSYFRMSPDCFNHLLSLVEPLIRKSDTRFRKSISAIESLAFALRFLATGDSQQTLSYSFQIGGATVGKIVSETYEAIYSALKEKYLSYPKCDNDWLHISEQFEEMWNMPHTIGYIDGKHIRMEYPKLSRNLHQNYKCFSMVLLSICDATYYFTLFDVGQYGSNNNSGVLANSQMNL